MIKNISIKMVRAYYSLIILMSLFLVAYADRPEKNLSTDGVLEKYGQLLMNRSFFAFPEVREKPVRWFDSIPESKFNIGLNPSPFRMTAQPGEFFVYQLGVWAIRSDIKDLRIEFSDLTDSKGAIISKDKMTCFNTGGVSIYGIPFSGKVIIPAGRLQALWTGIDHNDAGAGIYRGSVAVLANGEKQIVPLELNISGELVSNHGYNEGWRLSRLNWLNSTAGIDEEVTKGYLPVKVEKKTISILGRKMKIADNGLPSSIVSYFGPSNQSLVRKGEQVTDQPFRFIIEKDNGKIIALKPGKLTITDVTPSKVSWKVLNRSDECDLECSGQMEFDGFVEYLLKLTSKVPLKLKDIRLEVPVCKNKAEYMMGLGCEGGYRPTDWSWKWDTAKNQDMLWVGAVNGGLRIKWKAENYVRPLINIYYEFGRLNLPPSWGNEGNGGVNVSGDKDEAVINSYSGNRTMKEGEILNYDFELLITPFKLIDKQIKFNDRYYHGGGTNTSVKIEHARQVGANIINIHHAEDIYPFINYPYLDENIAGIKQLVADAHKADMRMKFYYTTRELTKNLPEFWAFRSLNGEIIFPGPGNDCKTIINPNGPNDWLVRNVREKYIPAWHNIIKEGVFKGETDLSVITTPDSRLNNFYVAGLEWMVQNLDIDGVYIDDSALDRFTLRRARKVIDRFRPEGRMDLHSWNHFNKWAGFANCLNLYMDLLPYFDLAWIGEGRNYDRMPDHWLVEVSGIPFGLPGQMLEGGGNPWRGMVYGITNRAGWTKNSPEYLWNFFDEYHFAEREMIAYWDKKCPVRLDNPNLVASVYTGKDDVVIAIGNWSSKDQAGLLRIDWKALNIKPEGKLFFVPFINEFQESGQLTPGNGIHIEGSKGKIIVIRK